MKDAAIELAAEERREKIKHEFEQLVKQIRESQTDDTFTYATFEATLQRTIEAPFATKVLVADGDEEVIFEVVAMSDEIKSSVAIKELVKRSIVDLLLKKEFISDDPTSDPKIKRKANKVTYTRRGTDGFCQIANMERQNGDDQTNVIDDIRTRRKKRLAEISGVITEITDLIVDFVANSAPYGDLSYNENAKRGFKHTDKYLKPLLRLLVPSSGKLSGKVDEKKELLRKVGCSKAIIDAELEKLKAEQTKLLEEENNDQQQDTQPANHAVGIETPEDADEDPSSTRFDEIQLSTVPM
jgi:hypothetical protein